MTTTPAPSVQSTPSLPSFVSSAVTSGTASAALASGFAPDVLSLSPSSGDIPRGRIHNPYASHTPGEGDHRTELAIHTRGSPDHTPATAARAELAAALQNGTGDLATALSKHGLSLGDLSAGTDRGTSQDREDRQGAPESGPRTASAPAQSRSSDPLPAPVATGVRVVA
jgi:hypothetical protein